MKRLGVLSRVAAVTMLLPAAVMAAEKGKITYAAGNCFIIQTERGATLFERSGGQSPKVDQDVAGVLHDFGYQQLQDGSGKDLMVGFVQEYAVKKEKNIGDFKKACR